MILFTDLDGTLLSDDKTISEGNRQAAAELFAAGGRLVLTTGRAVESVTSFAQELSLKERGGYIAAFNGALIYDCAADRVMVRREVTPEVIQYLFDEAKAAGIYAQTFCGGKVLAARRTPELARYCRHNRMEGVVTDHIAAYIKAHPARGAAAGPQKVMLIAPGERERLVRFRREHLAWEQGRCSSVFSSPEYLEYCPWGVDKGSAVTYLGRVIGEEDPACRETGCLPQTAVAAVCGNAGEKGDQREPARTGGASGGPRQTAGAAVCGNAAVKGDRRESARTGGASGGPLTVAVGDEENDLPMIRAAQIGIAMRNGTPEVRSAADYVTKADHNHDGVAEVIRRFGGAGRL